MTVQELIDKLKEFDPNIQVVYTYDSIHSNVSSVDEVDEYEWNCKVSDAGMPSWYREYTGKKIIVLE